jgi:hypothetical protein
MRELTNLVQFVEMLRRRPLPLATTFPKLRQEQGLPSRSTVLAVAGFAIPPNNGK